jgi:hypothetical protein
MMLMYQKARGITGLPMRLLAMNCTSQRPPNISAPVRPISFHRGDVDAEAGQPDDLLVHHARGASSTP